MGKQTCNEFFELVLRHGPDWEVSLNKRSDQVNRIWRRGGTRTRSPQGRKLQVSEDGREEFPEGAGLERGRVLEAAEGRTGEDALALRSKISETNRKAIYVVAMEMWQVFETAARRPTSLSISMTEPTGSARVAPTTSEGGQPPSQGDSPPMNQAPPSKPGSQMDRWTFATLSATSSEAN